MRVVDTPITELGLRRRRAWAPRWSGCARSIEFMTWNFALLAHRPGRQLRRQDALHVAAASSTCPIVFRGPNGAALQLAAQHSQAFESRGYAHIPGLKVVTPGTPADAKGLLKSAIRDDNPVIFIEGEMLYNTQGRGARREYLVPLGKADVKREGDHVTIITLRQDGASSRCRRPTSSPKEGIERRGASTSARSARWTSTPIAASVRKTNRAVVLEEGWEFAASARRWWTSSSATASTTSTRRCSACTRPTCRCRTTSTWSGPPKPDAAEDRSRRSGRCSISTSERTG